MSFKNLKLLNLNRLKAYRKSLIAKIESQSQIHWQCDHRDGYCCVDDTIKTMNIVFQKKYNNLKIELERVNKEYAFRSKLEYSKELKKKSILPGEFRHGKHIKYQQEL